MNRLYGLGLLLGLSSAPGMAEEAVWKEAGWEEAGWELPVSVDTPTLVAVEPDPDLWRAVRGNLQRVRIIDAEGHSIPLLPRQLIKTETRTRRIFLETVTGDPEPLEDNRFEFSCRVEPEAGPVKGLVFEVPMRDFERPVSVWGLSSDGEKTLLKDHALLADYSRFLDLRNVEVPLPENRFTRFLIVLERAEALKEQPFRDLMETRKAGEPAEETEWIRSLNRPLRIDRIRAYTEVSERVTGQPRIEAFPDLDFSPIASPEQGIRVFEAESGYRPLSALAVSAAEQNFSRQVRVRIPVRTGSGDSWRTVATTRLSRIEYRGTLREETVLRFPAQRAPRIRLEIESDGQSPLTLQNLEASGPVWRILFLAEPSKNYRIKVADKDLSPPEAPVVLALLEEGYDAETVRPRPLQRTPAKPAAASRLAVIIRSRAFFTSVLLLGGVVLGFGLLRAVKGIGPPP